LSRWLQTVPPVENTQLYKKREGGWGLHITSTERRRISSVEMGDHVAESGSEPSAHASSSLEDFSTLKMEAIRSSETSVHTISTRRHIPGDGILNSRHCENLKPYTGIYLSLTCSQKNK
jgi:hypothetical protein